MNMKLLRNFSVCLLVLISIFLCGCDSELESATITRDSAMTGGTLSFVFDSAAKKVWVGGEGEIVQHSEAIEELGLSAGCRIGFLVTAPNAELDLSTATLEMNGVTYSSGEFLESVDGQKQPFFNIYPIFSEDDRQVSFTVKWTEGTAKQTYQIFVKEGTSWEEES